MATCGDITPVKSTGIPDKSGPGPIPGFLELINKWPTAIPLDTLWGVDFNTLYTRDIRQEIAEPINSRGASESDFWQIGDSVDLIKQNIVNKTFRDNNGQTWFKTNMLANTIKLIGEQIDTDRVGSVNSEGYLKGLITKGRGDLGYLDIAFVETNISYVDYIIRPWLIKIARQSLITRPDGPDRIPITCTLYGLTKANKKPVPRKKFVFFNAFPVTVDDDEYDYAESQVHFRKVYFAFTHYAMLKVNTEGAENLEC